MQFLRPHPDRIHRRRTRSLDRHTHSAMCHPKIIYKYLRFLLKILLIHTVTFVVFGSLLNMNLQRFTLMKNVWNCNAIFFVKSQHWCTYYTSSFNIFIFHEYSSHFEKQLIAIYGAKIRGSVFRVIILILDREF